MMETDIEQRLNDRKQILSAIILSKALTFAEISHTRSGKVRGMQVLKEVMVLLQANGLADFEED